MNILWLLCSPCPSLKLSFFLIYKREELMLLNCGVGEDSWESLGLQGDQPVHSEGDQPWDFFGRNDAEAEAPVLWPPHAESWLIGKDSDAGKGWRQEEKGMIEDEMVGWHHWLGGHESVQIPGDSEGQGGLLCCSSRVAKSRTQLSDWTELNWAIHIYTTSLSCSSSAWLSRPLGSAAVLC